MSHRDLTGQVSRRGLRARYDPRGAFRFPQRGIRKNPASPASDAVALGVALYKYTRKPDNSADALESLEIFRTKCAAHFPSHQIMPASLKYPRN